MAIKERKQITGTEAQIKGYAGHNGVLAYATDTKHLHVLSGTAGTTTELANRTDIPDITGKADTTYVNAELAKKQPNGDYATNTALTQGLAGKADSSHTHTKSQITDFPTIPDAIPKNGSRGAIAGYEEWVIVSATTTLSVSSGDTVRMDPDGEEVTITVEECPVDQVATKLVWVVNSNKSITINGNVDWFGDDAPTLNSATAVLLFCFHDGSTDCRLIGQWD